MRRRLDPGRIAALVGVQQARQAQAEDALSQARADQDAAEAALRTRRDALDQADRDWADCLDRTGFAPDYARGLADRVIARENEAEAAGYARRGAADAHRVRQDEWRIAEVRTRTAEDALTQALRAAARRREDRRLDALSDRVTQNWMMR